MVKAKGRRSSFCVQCLGQFVVRRAKDAMEGFDGEEGFAHGDGAAQFLRPAADEEGVLCFVAERGGFFFVEDG